MGMQEPSQAPPASRKKDEVSYLMLFCALLMARNPRATLEQSMQVVPLSRKVRRLAGELIHSARMETPHPAL